MDKMPATMAVSMTTLSFPGQTLRPFDETQDRLCSGQALRYALCATQDKIARNFYLRKKPSLFEPLGNRADLPW